MVRNRPDGAKPPVRERLRSVPSRDAVARWLVGTLLRVRTTVFRSCGTPPPHGSFGGDGRKTISACTCRSVPVKPHSGLGPHPLSQRFRGATRIKIKERGERCLYPPSWLPGVARPPTKSRAGRRDLATSRVTKATSRIRSEHAQTLGSMLCTTLSWPVPRGRSYERIRAPHRAVNDPSRGMLCVCV